MSSSTTPTIFWHDYETFGVNPAKDRPSQFAGIRTDFDLNIIGEQETFYCKVANDYLPSPEAILITGITPQLANLKGIPETEFIGKVHSLFSQANTCVAGYNSIRFDDEVSRHGFYRNFYDPYAREWQHGNSRWDVIDLVRACYAFRPEGIEWPQKEDGSPSFKLEHLTQANGLSHEKAHDAMSDVYATIDMAKLIKQKQPKLFDYFFGLRKKQEVSKLIDILNMQPMIYVSSKISSLHGCASIIAPVAHNSTNKNAIICVNLAMDISPLIELNVEQIRERIYTRRDDLGSDELPISVKQVHINKCPFIASTKILTDKNAERLAIDKPFARKQYKLLKQHPELREKLVAVLDVEYQSDSTDPDLQLYSGGFFSSADKAKMEIIRHTLPQNLAALKLHFDDSRLKEMLFRYRGRNYPEFFDESELMKWREFCQSRLNDPDYMFKLENLVNETSQSEDKQKLLIALCHYLSNL